MGDRIEMQLLVVDGNDEEPLSSVQTPENKSEKSPYYGIILATISSLFFSLCSVIVKWMVSVDPIELAIYRFVGVFLPTIPLLIWNKENPFPRDKHLLLLLRSFAGTTGLMLSFYAFRHMLLGDASVIVFSVPVFVAIFARIFLKEPCGLFNVITVALTVLGVILISRPTFLFSSIELAPNEKYELMWGVITAFAATLFGASAYVLLRALKSLHFSVVMFNFGMYALVLTSGTSWAMNVLCWPQCGIDRFLIVLLALFSFCGQTLLTMASQYENAGFVAVARTSDIVFAFIWQILFFNQVPDIFSILGALLVTSSVVIIGLRKWVLSLPDENPNKRKFNILAK